MGWPGPPTARQVSVVQQWLREEWDRPSRTDWYIMSLRCSIERYIHMRAGITDNLPDTAAMQLAFNVAEPTPTGDAAQDSEARKDYEMRISQAAAIARLGDRAALIREVPLPPESGGDYVIEEQPDWTWKG